MLSQVGFLIEVFFYLSAHRLNFTILDMICPYKVKVPKSWCSDANMFGDAANFSSF